MTDRRAIGTGWVFVCALAVGAPGVATLAAAEEIAAKRAQEVGLQPGMMLDQSTASLAKGLMPPEILKHYEQGEYKNEIADWPATTGTHGPDFEAQTKRNAETLTLDENDTIVDKSTGKQPPHIYGTPFPTIDPKDPRAPVKVLWNYFYNYYWNGNSHNVVDLVWVNPTGFDRKAGQDVYFKYYDGLPPDLRPAENPLNLLNQFIAATIDPQDLYGTTALGWRYRDPQQRDSVWAYVPALRRIRGLSPANRSDGFLGSDMSQDDGPYFDGKPEDFTWKLVGEEEILRHVDPYRLKQECKVLPLPEGGWRTVFPDVPNLGFQTPDWKGVAWAPTVMKLARRKVWIIEGVPKDKYYLYGRIELRIDQHSWQGSYNRKFSWQGELLNTSMAAGGPGWPTPDGKHFLSIGGCGGAAAQIAENVKLNRATLARISPKADIPNDRHVPMDPSFFDYQTLYRFGK
ncbi:MAG: outer membrane lipoprotein-sorting protein [Candidatus Binatia bacterium]